MRTIIFENFKNNIEILKDVIINENKEIKLNHKIIYDDYPTIEELEKLLFQVYENNLKDIIYKDCLENEKWKLEFKNITWNTIELSRDELLKQFAIPDNFDVLKISLIIEVYYTFIFHKI